VVETKAPGQTVVEAARHAPPATANTAAQHPTGGMAITGTDVARVAAVAVAATAAGAALTIATRTPRSDRQPSPPDDS
jgi:hypothetical protein